MAAGGAINLSQLEAHLKEELGIVLKLDRSPIFKKVAMALESGAKDCFKNSRSPDGKPWTPLKHKRVRGGNLPLLDRGLLRASLSANAVGHIHIEGPDSLVWGSNLVNAAVHNYGAIISPKRGKFLCIPASMEALRVGSPRKFPNARKRLKWRFGKRGGIVYEYTNKGPKKKRNETFEQIDNSVAIIHYYLTKSIQIPARPFIGISNETQGVIQDIIQKEVFKQLKKGLKGVV